MHPVHPATIALALACLALFAPAARAVVPLQRIAVGGPLPTISLGNDLSCQVTAQGDPQPSFEPIGSELGDCGMYFRVTNTGTGEVTLFGPSDRVFLPTPDQVVTPDESFAPNGQARSDSPGSSTVQTRVLLGTTGINAFQVDFYGGGTDGYSTSVQLQNTSPTETYQVTAYRVVLCYLQGGTGGDVGFHDLFNGGLEHPGCATAGGVSPARSESLVGVSQPSNWVVANYGDTRSLFNAGEFPNTCVSCGQPDDLLVGLSWTRVLAPVGGLGDVEFQTQSSGAPGGPAPVAGQSGTASTESGTVRFKAPGGQFVDLAGAQSIPVGSLVDTTNGVVRLKVAASGKAKTRTGSFGGGIFRFTQNRQKVGRKRLLTSRLALRGGNFSVCGTRGARGDASRRRVVRYLTAKASGRFAVVGKNSSGIERGTRWTTSDTCDGTLTAVQQGSVAVTDFARRETVVVRAGRSYLARPKSRRR